MAGFNLNFVVLMAMMVASMQFHGTMAQTRHVVGDTLGWTIPPGGAVAYTNWASLQTFTVGDVLVFNFTNGRHDVAEVPEAAYEPCTATNPISLATISPATLNLTTPGTHYYICTFTSHCQIGQKLTINVSAATTTTPPSVTPTSPPTIAPTPPSVTPTSPPTIAPTPPSVTPTSPPTFAPTPPSVTPTSPPTIAPTPTPLVTPTYPPTIAPSTPPSATPPTTMPSPPSPPTPSPNSSPSSPPTNTTTPTTSGSSPTGSSTPPPPPNGASSFTTMAYVTFLTIALAFLNY